MGKDESDNPISLVQGGNSSSLILKFGQSTLYMCHERIMWTLLSSVCKWWGWLLKPKTYPPWHRELSHDLDCKVTMQVADHKTLSCFAVLFGRILMSPTLDPKQLGRHPPLPLLWIFFLGSSVSVCHNDLTSSPMCDVHSQSHTPIFRFLSKSQWSIILFMKRSLCCTLSLRNSNMSHFKAHENFTYSFQNLSTWSHLCHFVGLINMMFLFG